MGASASIINNCGVICFLSLLFSCQDALLRLLNFFCLPLKLFNPFDLINTSIDVALHISSFDRIDCSGDSIPQISLAIIFLPPYSSESLLKLSLRRKNIHEDENDLFVLWAAVVNSSHEINFGSKKFNGSWQLWQIGRIDFWTGLATVYVHSNDIGVDVNMAMRFWLELLKVWFLAVYEHGMLAHLKNLENLSALD